jgi:hypothetical protein|tara:strand:+ start:76 stop:1359 length:1284 start_codon:yes stop_codon:yes gene_type:complete
MKKIFLLLTFLSGINTAISQNAPVDFETGGYGADWTWTVFENDTNPPLEIVANPDPSGINTSETVAKFTALQLGQPYAGVESLHGSDIGTFDLTASNALVNIMVYKTKISDIGIKYVTPSGGAQMEIKVANTLVNQWELITIDFSDYIGLGETTGLDQIVIFPDFITRDADDIIYFDNISFGPFEPGEIIELPVDFELDADYGIIGFEGAESALVQNPDPSGENTSETVVESIKTEGAQFYAGTAMGLDTPIDFSESESISIKTWSPKADIPVRLKLEAAGGVFIELDTNTTQENQWETLTWDFSGQTSGIDFTTVVIFFEFLPDLPGDGSTYYYDDIEVAQALSISDYESFSVNSFPNPVKNTWNVSSIDEISEITIYNILGENLATFFPNMNTFSLDMSLFNSGIYLMKLVSSKRETNTLKVLKN